MALNHEVCNECRHQDAFSRNECEYHIKLGQALGCEMFKRIRAEPRYEQRDGILVEVRS